MIVYLSDTDKNLEVMIDAHATLFDKEYHRFQGDLVCYTCGRDEKGFNITAPLKIKRVWFGCKTCNFLICFDMEYDDNLPPARGARFYEDCQHVWRKKY